jgi:predicted amidohydrolase YtcJ
VVVSDAGVIASLVAADGPPARTPGGAALPVLRLPPGAFIAPGLRDPHVHLRAAAAAQISVDCATGDVPGLLARLHARALMTPPGGWVRGWGYDESRLAERRPPGAGELDTAGAGHPVVVHHRTGHLAVANHAALVALGVPLHGPPGVDDVGVERDATGRVTGLLVDAHPLLRRAPRLDPAALDGAVAGLGAQLSRAGVTAVTDATATNDLADIEQLHRWAAAGLLPARLRAFVAPTAVRDAVAAEVPIPPQARSGAPSAPPGCLVVGAKVVAPAGDIAGLIRLARRDGWPVAVHATDVEELAAALGALQHLGPPRWGRDRIEHAGLVLPEQRRLLARLGVAVVSNPAFLALRGSKYVEMLSAVERQWLYPVRSLLRSGVLVAAASDAPVTPPEPLLAVTAASTRAVGEGPARGAVLGSGERVRIPWALALVTTLAGRVDGLDVRVAPGNPADLVVLSRTPAPGPDTSGRVAGALRVLATVVDGRPLMLDPRLDARDFDHVGGAHTVSDTDGEPDSST